MSSGNIFRQAIAGLSLLTIPITGYVVAKQAVFKVDPGQNAIVFSKITGMKNSVLREGWHLLLPWFERPIIYDVKSHPRVFSNSSGTKDLQMVDISLWVLYKPSATNLVEVYRRVGKDYDARVLPSIVQETLGTVVAQYNAT